MTQPTPRRRPLPALLILVATVLLAVPQVSAGEVEDQLEFGVKMARRGLWSEALFRFRQAEKIDANDPHVLNNLAVAYEANGLFDEALEAYRRALQISPGDRDLKQNYSRFVEFYQSFNAAREGEDGEGAEAEASDGGEAEEAATASESDDSDEGNGAG